MRSLVIVAIVLLAGCASAPPPLRQGEPTFHDATPRPSAPQPKVEWMSIAQGDLLLSPSDSTIPATVPNGTLDVRVNMTLSGGAAYGLNVRMGECVWQRASAFVAGQEIVADCGGLGGGQDVLAIATTTGAVDARVNASALVCLRQPGERACPPAGAVGS